MRNKPSANEPPDDKENTAERPPVSIKPVKKKIGEAPGNVRRREAWYQKRTAGRPDRSAS